MNENVFKIVVGAVKDLNEELLNHDLEEPTKETKLYGANGSLDSLALVSLISDIEQNVSDFFGREIVLADERAMSLRMSPFRSVGTIVKYIESLLEEET